MNILVIVVFTLGMHLWYIGCMIVCCKHYEDKGHNFIVIVDMIIFLFPFHIYFYDYLECMCKGCSNWFCLSVICHTLSGYFLRVYGVD